MYGVGQSSSPRRGIVVIVGVMVLALILGGLFYLFYALVLRDKDTTPAVEATTTAMQVASTLESTTPPLTAPANTATVRPSTPTLRPTLPPTDTPMPTATLRPPPEVITTGVRARVNISDGLGLNLRDQPTLSGSTVITQLVGGAEVDVIDGPEDVGDLRWWSVDGGAGKIGWVVEAFGGETWLVPLDWTDQSPPLAAPPPEATVTPTPTLTPTVAAPTATTPPEPTAILTATAVLTPTATPEGGIPSPTVGGRARVTTRYQFINLRADPGLGGEAIAQLSDGTVVTILEGPQQADNLVWWKVDDGQGHVGWAAERVGVEVLLVPLP